jgi:hypothetical protein
VLNERSGLQRVATFAIASVLLQWAWEVAHGPAYVETALPLSNRIWHCAPMALVDAAWSALLVAAAAILAPQIGWSSRRAVAWTTAALGTVTATAFEMWAVGRGRWTYNGYMPVLPLVGAGVWPVLQMSLLPPAAYLLSCVGRRRRLHASVP